MRICKAKPCRTTIDPNAPKHVRWCSPECGTSLALAALEKKKAQVARQQAKEQKATERAQRQNTRIRRESLKPRAKWLREAQDAFNAYIRWRDRDLPCICCNEWGEGEDWQPGGKWDAGHFLSRGAFPELRFEEFNCHRQLKSCNAGSSKYARKGRTVSANYRENLIKKIGLNKVLWLEGPHEAKKYSVEDLKQIKAHYKEKLKCLAT